MAALRTREQLIDALSQASELEHALCCMYLFSAFSLKKSVDEGLNWSQAEANRKLAGILLLIAREEMAHLGSACNLLSSIGGTADFWRPAFPTDMGLASPLELRGFSLEEAERYVLLEASESSDSASQATIGRLYREIRAAFEVGPEEELFAAPAAAQLSIDFPSSVRLKPIRNRATALKAIDSVVEEGDSGPASHRHRLREAHRLLAAEIDADPSFEPSRPVVRNPSTGSGPAEVTVITDPNALAAMRLFNDAYGLLLLMLSRLASPAGETSQELEVLGSTVYLPLMTMVIRPLADMLTTMPAGPEYPGMTAGPSFEVSRFPHLPCDAGVAWMRMRSSLTALVEGCGAAAGRGFGGARGQYLCQNLRAIQANLARAMRA